VTASANDLRHRLHRQPELSGQEAGTAALMAEAFRASGADRIVEGLGGHGIAAVFTGRESGPTILLRCELDALPIAEVPGRPHGSRVADTAHLCGHDGHMAILARVADSLGDERPARGRVVLLCQGAEETGEGAVAVAGDPAYAALHPDWAFALHNVPGHRAGEVLIRAGAITSASRGMELKLTGRSAHAARPESGRSPARALATLIADLQACGDPSEGTLVTVVGARLGDRAFGTAPGDAVLWATLRSASNEAMAGLVRHAEERVHAVATRDGLRTEMTWHDVFPATVNDEQAVEQIHAAASPLPVRTPEAPFRWSEDFGRLLIPGTRGALFGFGAGEHCPDLHTPDYDFPDAVVEPAEKPRLAGRGLALPGRPDAAQAVADHGRRDQRRGRAALRQPQAW